MLDLPMIRFMYPQYNSVSDYELSKAYHQKYHPEMPYDQFAKEFDGPLQEDKVALAVKRYNADNPEHPITKDKIRDLKGFWDYVGLGIESFSDSVSNTAPEFAARAWRGGNIDPNNETWADRTIRQKQKDSAARIPTRQEIEGDALANALYQGPQSVATSLATTLGGAAIGGAAGTAVGGPAGTPVGAMVGAGTLSGLVYYRSAKDQFVSEVHDKITELRGKPLTSEESARLNVAIEDDAVKAGLYEAAPEALSSAFTTLLFGGGQTTKLLKQFGLNGLGKIGEKVGAHALTRIPAKLAAEIGEEEITEGITYGLQETQRKEYGLRDTDPSLGEFIETQAGPIAVGSLLQAGGMKLASKLANRNKVSPFVPPSEETEATPPSAPKPLTLEELRVLSNSGPSYDGAEKFISPWREKTTQTQYPPVIRSDQPVDLLSLNGNTPMAGLAGLEKNTSPTSRAALPEDYIDVDYSVIPEGQGTFPPLPQHQLPAGTGRQSGFNGAGPEAPLQGLSFLASPQMYQPQPEMPSTFPLPGNVGGKPGPQFSPTGGVPQLTPRADTTNKALALGMAAPDMMPVPHRGLINLPFMRGATSTAPVNTPQLPPLPTVTQPQRLVEPEFTFSSSSSPAQPALESPVSPRPTPNIARAMTMAQRLQSGTMTPEELRTVYEAYRRNHPALAHELSLMSRSTLLSWVPPDMKRAARRSKRQKIAQMLLEYMDGLFSRSNTIPTNLKEEKRDARSEEQKYGRTEDQGAITQPGLEPNYSQPNEQPSVVMGNGERRKGEPEHNAVTVPQRTQIAIPNRGKADVTYEIVEADALKTSHLPSAGFQKNPAYALENERRYHDEPASQAKVMENAAQLDPAFLMDSVDANHGAPVVDREGNVLGGNGRAMSISRAYESFPERGKQYREALKAKAEKLGIDPAQIDAMRSPVLVRRLDRAMAPEERQQFVTAMNDDFKASREKKAEGKTRGDRLSPATIDALAKGLRDTDSLREFFDSPKSASIVERLLADGVIQPTERNVYIGADGLLNPDGKGVVEAALRGRIARNYETLALLPADIQGKLDAAIPHILVAEGVGGKWNITEHVRDAVDLLAEYKKSGIKEPVIFLKQVNMLTGTAPVQNASKESLAIFQMALQGKKSEFAKAFAQYASEAKRSPEAGGIPGVAKPQDRAFRDAFGMEPEPSPAKPKMKEEGEPQAKEKPKEQPPKEESVERMEGTEVLHVKRHDILYKSLLEGKASLEEYQDGFSNLLKNEEAIRTELSGMTVKELLSRGGTMFTSRYKGEKKADIVDALYHNMLSDFTLGQSYTVDIGTKDYRSSAIASIRKIVDSQTNETLATFANKVAEQRKEYESQYKAKKEAVENPKTLEAFKAFMRFHMDEGKTAEAARDLLSFEQREEFDRLAAEESRRLRKIPAESVVAPTSQTSDGQIIATKHTRKGHDLFVVRLAERVNRENYLALLSNAKKLGGYYSKFRGNGAVPGFQFTERENAEAFLKLVQGDNAEAQETIKVRQDAYEDDRSQTAVQRLNEMADRLDIDADTSLNAIRKVNTAKRVRQAASADATAYANKSLAKTMRNIANAIESGEAQFLDRVREKKQVELLRDTLRLAKWEESKAKYPSWNEREKESEKPATSQTVEYAVFPHYKLYRSGWAELGRKLTEKDGTKTLGKKILSMADDVNEAYLDFAKEHLSEVSAYSTNGGVPAVFSSREEAEKAIGRSGYRGKAVVLPVKRGENRIILSPSAAQERGVWKGDDDRMITLRPEFVDELFNKLGNESKDIPWQLSSIRQKRKALARMGIETPAEYRTALREFISLQEETKPNKIRELERAALNDAAKNRGWMDFFPTPAAVTEEMLAAADIKPGMTVLEPSAGMGHIADRIREKGVDPVVSELEPQKRELLEAKGYKIVGKDFMEDVQAGENYDRIVMNPPFSRRQDTEHVRRAYDLLKPGGRLVAIVSEGSFFGKDKKATEFRNWLEEIGGTSEKLPEGSFNDPSLPSTTGVNTRMVVIDKPSTVLHASLKEESGSIKPGEFLSPGRRVGPHVPLSAAQVVVNKLQERAANAAETQVVQSFEELPEHIRQAYGDEASRLEGVYDPETGKVYLVADNIRGIGRVAEVWMHENLAHHGLNGLVGKGEKRRILNRLWQRMGGLGNADLKEIAHRYGVDPRSDADARELVMEEYVANLAEKKAGDKLSGQDQTYWRRFVEAVLRAWNAVVDFVAGRTGTMRYENLDSLLSALDRYVFEGKPEGIIEQGGTASAMESRRADPNNARFSPDTGKATDFVTLPDGSVDFAQFPETRLMDFRLLKGAPIRLERGTHSLEGGQGFRHIEANHGDDIRKAGYGSVQEFIWDLVNGYDEIWEGQGKSFLLVKNKGANSRLAGFIELEREGTFYKIKNAYPVDINYPTKATRKQLWKSAPPSSITTGEQSPSTPVSGHRNPFRGQTGNLQGQRGQSVSIGIQHGGGERKPKASLRDIGSVKDIIGLSAKDALNIASNDPHIGKFFSRSEDVTLMQRIFMLPHWLAKKYPNFKTVYERQLRRMDERAAEVASSLQEIPSLFDGNNLSNEDMAQLNKLVWDNDGKQIAELEEIDKFLTDEKLDNGRTTITTNPEWYEGYDEWLNKQSVSESVKKAMREIRRSLDNDLVRAHNRLAGISEMNDGVIQGFRTQVGHIHNYFPHHRYGDYYIQGKDKDGNVVFREHFDALTTMKARQQAVKRIEELEKEYPDAIFDSGKNTKLPDEAFGRIIDPEAMEQIIKAALAKVSDKEQASKIAEVLHESVADVIKSTGWGSHAIRRKNIPGFEKDDLYRVLYDYKSGLSGWLTKIEASKDFATALSNINAKTNPNEWSYASQYVKDMLRNSDAIDRGVGKVKTLAFAWYLGANLKTAVVNLTQNIIIGVPRLEMDVTSGARYYIRGAQKQIVNQLDRRFHDKNSSKGLSEEEAQLIKELYTDSVIADVYIEEVRGHMSGGKNARMWNKLMKFMGYPMSVAERFNRGSLALAAFRAAREGKLKPAAMRRYGVGENGIATYEQAKAFAEDVVRDSHYVYGKSNAPELLRSSAAGRGLGAAFTFKTFTANTVGLWYWALTTQGMEGAKMVGKGLAATAAMGGLVSLPLYTTLQALAQAMSGDDDDWTETIRRNLPEDDLLRDVVCYGLPASVGVNLGGSLKMELAITRGMQRGSTPKEVLTEGIGDIIGIPWDLFIEKPSKVIDAVRVDSAWRAIESMAPTFVSNAMKGYRLVTEGQKTLKGKDINEPGQKGPRKLTELEGLGMLLGFQPVSNTKSYDSYNARQHADKIRSEKIGEVALKMLKAKEADDLAGMAAAKRIMLEWNKKMEAENKPWMKFALKDMRRRMVALRRERSLSKRQRQQLKETVW